MCNDGKCHHGAAMDRRGFVGLVAAGAVAAVAGPALASGKAQALMLSCMDYRLDDDVVQFMNTLGLNGQYDHVVLAGASLGVVADQLADWHKTFWDQLGLAIQLHGITEVIVVDHRDCGAYRMVLGEAAVADSAMELAAHTTVIQFFAQRLKERHPDLTMRAYLMALNGMAEEIVLPGEPEVAEQPDHADG